MVCPVDETIETIRKYGHVPEAVVESLCSKAEEILIEEANVQLIDPPVTICGDIHGQFHDLLKLFRIGGDCPDTKYLFLGDFVDRGYHSLETFLLLMCLKIRYPDRITLIRGNHESRQITSAYGFYDECLRKYGSPHVWRLCCQVFDYLALGALVGGPGGVFCVHGGLSPSIKHLSEIAYIDRKQEVPHDGPMCDLLWSDPNDDSMTDGLRLDLADESGDIDESEPIATVRDDTNSNENNDNNNDNDNDNNNNNQNYINGPIRPKLKEKSAIHVENNVCSQTARENTSLFGPGTANAMEMYDKLSSDSWSVSPRGAGYLFGAMPTKAFNHINNTSVIARAHQLVMEGYKEIFDKQLVTVWSAPNYCYRCGNVAALLRIGEDLSRDYKVFETDDANLPLPVSVPKPEYFL